MRVTTSLDLTVRQRLALTPQLRQAIRLLQLPLAELQLEVEEVLERNPMLELMEEENDYLHNGDSQPSVDGEEFDPLEPLDFSWEDLYEAFPSPSPNDELQIQDKEPEDLKKYLVWQLEISTTDELELQAGYVLIDALDEGGLLTTPLRELQNAFPEIPLDIWNRALRKIQSFDPPGVGARSVQEALELQLQQFPPSPTRDLAMSLLRLGLGEIRSLELSRLRARLSCRQEDLRAALSLLRRLNPRPGSAVGAVSLTYIVPDVIVKFKEKDLEVEINEEALPKLRIHPLYAKIIERQRDRENQALRALLQEARWFLRALESRKETLLRVSRVIVEWQRDFFLFGEEALKPLTLKEIASEVGLHESTVSRAVYQKYISTPRGLLPFKFFFSSRLLTIRGETSAAAIKAKIKSLIEQEDPQKPLSDAKIALLLQKEGIDIARRTVAKYREDLEIPPSNVRKYRFQ